MLFRTYSAIPLGMDAVRIEIEAVSTQGVPSFILIGLPNRAVHESRERVTSALLHCGIRIRSKRTVVNLAPADLKKTNNALELAIAVSILKMYGEIDVDTDNTLFLGELSLNGKIKPVTGALALVLAAKRMGFKSVIFPQGNVDEVRIVSDIELFPISHLKEFIDYGKKKTYLSPLSKTSFSNIIKKNHDADFSSVYGQYEAKRALEIAIAGGHNVLLMGPPGAGKSLLAKTAVSILPKLSLEEMIEVNQLYSLAGLSKGLVCQRPFRSPHHTTSKTALVGGGSLLKPGEISLAHRGVLFLDELPEFSRDSLEALRQPLEDKRLTIARVDGVFSFPAAFMLIAAANPCPCGYYQSNQKECNCSDNQLRQYRSKLSGPLMDRIDIHINVKQVDVSAMQDSIGRNIDNGENASNNKSETMLINVKVARENQFKRYESSLTNAELSIEKINKHCVLDLESKQLLSVAAKNLNLSARSYFKIIKVARTIADLESSRDILRSHIAEAISYRNTL